MNVKRLKKLERLLRADAVKPKGVKFDLRSWASNGRRQDAYRNLLSVDEKKRKIAVNCNTHACAVGLACISGAFKKDGLAYDITYSGVLVPSFSGYQNWDAVESFFDLSCKEVRWLFSHENYLVFKGAEAEIAVANRIAEFTKGLIVPGGNISI